jgi:hypothetical protein
MRVASHLGSFLSCRSKVRDRAELFAEMRDMGVRGLLVYCADYQCSHSIAILGAVFCAGTISIPHS